MLCLSLLSYWLPEKRLRWGWCLVEYVAEGLRTSFKVGEDADAVSLLVVRGSWVCVGHSVAQRVVEQRRDLACSRGDCLGLADTCRQPSVECTQRGLCSSDGHRREPQQRRRPTA